MKVWVLTFPEFDGVWVFDSPEKAKAAVDEDEATADDRIDHSIVEVEVE